jgi:hypothetical protein
MGQIKQFPILHPPGPLKAAGQSPDLPAFEMKSFMVRSIEEI